MNVNVTQVATRYMMKGAIEYRFNDEVGVKGRKLQGYAATWNTTAKIGHFDEQVARGAFERSIRERDVVAVVDHDLSRVLGRTRSGTLKLNEDHRGLQFEIDIADTTLGRDVVTLVERNDHGGCSFGFRVVKDEWVNDLRTLVEIDLWEVSIVAGFPAYPNTSVQARSNPRLRLLRRYLDAI